jgi:tRNA A37 methylthiotransferase MiaB
MRPELIQIIANTPGVVPYFDLSFQHASSTLLRRMKRFGGSEAFLELLQTARSANPLLGARTNVIVGFPGETDEDLVELAPFIESARLDAVGVFAYSDEEGTAAVDLDGHLPEHEVLARRDYISTLAHRMCDEVALDRIGQRVQVLIEEAKAGRSAHQGPEVDGMTTVISDGIIPVGSIVDAIVIDTEGIDLIAEVVTA